jgi:hypothetical protein
MVTFLRETAARVRALFRPHDLDRDFEQELESHLAMLTEDNVRRGMPPGQARRAALIRMGAPRAIREQHRTVRGLPAVEAVLHDLRFAFRLIAKDRWFSAAVIVVLALGIGANATGFTIVNAAFLRGLPFEESDRLYVLSWLNRTGRRSSASLAELQDWREQSRSFTGLAAYRDATMNLSDDRALPELASGNGSPPTRSGSSDSRRSSAVISTPATSAQGPTRSPSSATASGRTGTAAILT